ncbi:MAG: hypothetical protein IJ039_05795 [Clostridia bacterium]|nr:hypothetical protein [Clostridia bacterium]
MAQFTNQAQLTYGNVVTSSNVAVGEIVAVLSATKTAIRQEYNQGSAIAYIINIVNSGSTNVTGLTVSDNLGEYEFGVGTLVPLDYVDGTLLYFLDGTPQPAPQVSSENGLTVTGISVPANGNALLVYETNVNGYAPLNEGGTITNTVTITGECANVVASETVSAASAPQITISKSISPVPVSCGDRVIYTFLIQNTGASPLAATDNAVVTDTFNPIISDVTATLNGAPVEFTYDEATGELATAQGAVTVPGATYTQDLTTGLWSITPGTATLVVTGTI